MCEINPKQNQFHQGYIVEQDDALRELKSKIEQVGISNHH